MSRQSQQRREEEVEVDSEEVEEVQYYEEIEKLQEQGQQTTLFTCAQMKQKYRNLIPLAHLTFSVLPWCRNKLEIFPNSQSIKPPSENWEKKRDGRVQRA